MPALPSTDSEGIDVRWETNRDAALAAGLRVGGYWRAFPAVDLTAQIERFCARLDGTDLPPMLDVEDAQGWAPAHLTDWATTAMNAVRTRTGRTPLLYTGRWFLANALEAERLGWWYLGLAAWSGVPEGDWPDPRAVLWQHAGDVAVPWADGNVDLDRWRGPLPS